MKDPVTIDRQTARRFILGLQGLWPGRRWRGKEGTAQALKAIEAVQMDPLNVVARSHDIVLWGRVLDYRPDYLNELLYKDRLFFDYGGGLFIYPMSELPYWRLHMDRRREEKRWAQFAAENPQVIEQVCEALRRDGPLGNRDFTGNRQVKSYRGRKDTSLALYYLWLTGELMVHHREGFERVYDFREQVAPPEWGRSATEAETEAYFSRKSVAFLGLISARGWKNTLAGDLLQKVSPQEAERRLAVLVEQGALAPVRVEGWKDLHYTLAENLPLLADLAAGRIPAVWEPLETTTAEEALFLAPLDIVSARGRAMKLFDFEYVWEVYKPAEKRRWGYYTLPILYGDRLVARMDPRLDRGENTLRILGFWPEEPALVDDPDFAAAFARGLQRFAAFLGASSLDLSGIESIPLRRRLAG